jgi:diguanylate cyclase (GGDEF)-like protein
MTSKQSTTPTGTWKATGSWPQWVDRSYAWPGDSDICCRYGGEEFAVILPLTDVREAGSIADRLRMELGMVLPGRGTLTVSIGVASSGKNTETDRDLVEEADMALYRAKKRGKNRIVVAADQEAGSEE